MSSPSQIDIALRLVPDHADRVLSSLPTNPQLATASDTHGYTLLHAAASYGHLDLLRALVQTYKADVDIGDEDGETPLFYAERLDVVKCLISELAADVLVTNIDGQGVIQKWEEEGEGAWVAETVAYVKGLSSSSSFADAQQQNGGPASSQQMVEGSSASQAQLLLDQPAMVPENVQVNFGTMSELPAAEAADPEIRRKIEELAQRGDLDSEKTQAELRALITEVVTGMREEAVVGARDPQRRRVED